MAKKIKVFLACSGIMLIILGIICLASPASALISLSWVLGLMTLISGVSELVAVLNAQENIPNSGTRVLSAILQIVVGCILLAHPVITAVSITLVFAFWVLFEGIVVIVKSFDYKKVGYKAWWLILLLGVCGTVLGFAAVCNPVAAGKTLTVLVGLAVIAEGVSYLVALGGINRFQKKVKGVVKNLTAEEQ